MNACYSFLVVLLLAASSLAQNLIPDGSFEEPKDRDRFGRVFAKWEGNVYEPPAKFEVGRVAHSGKTSCEMDADLRGKIRIFTPEIKLEPGRYRLQLFARGLDLVKGQYPQPVDLLAFDGVYRPIKLSGSFGWTPITHVFDVPAGAKPGRFSIGVLSGGRMWVDDVSLEKVGESVDVTKEPVIGQEESPLAPPAEIKEAIHCRTCGFKNDSKADSCWTCGRAMQTKARDKSVPPVKMIADFEDGMKPFAGGQHIRADALSGKGSARVEGKWISIDGKQDWSQYDYLKFEVFNPSDEPVSMLIEIRDAQTREYWTRVNQTVVVPPGRSTASLRTDLYVGEKSRPGRPLLRDQITRFIISPDPKTVVIDDVRLEQLDSDVARFPELIAFDFGPQDSPVMEGFTQMTAIPQYSSLRGHGWTKADFWRAFNVYQPDALFQDFICPHSGTFRVDVPNGKYHVWMNIDSPGGYWGEPQVYRKRRVLANGNPIVDETRDFDSFMKHHWRNAHREDLPGIDVFEQYVQPMFGLKQFEVDVTDGAIELSFEGQSWANCLSALVIYPADKKQRGESLLQWVTQRRKVQFEEYFKQVMPKRAPAPTAPFIAFTRDIGKAVQPFDGPGEKETLSNDPITLDVARGEESALTFAIQPSADLGTLDLALSDFKNDAGAVLDKSSLQAGWIEYRISRIAMDGTSYAVRPRYWRPTPAPAAPGVTRRFWVRVKPSLDAAPGAYHGTMTIRPQNGPTLNIAATIRVLPFALDLITDVAAGPWGSGISPGWMGDDEQTKQWNWQMFEKALIALRDAGCTSFSGRPHLSVKAANGKITLDTTIADREMKLIRQYGFTQLISNYGVGANLAYNPYGLGGGPDEAAARRAGFADMQSFLKTLWGAIDAHAIANDWVPIAWNLCDEPVNEAILASTKNAAAHKAIAGDLKRTTFMGATSLKGNDPKDPHVGLVQALPIASMNIHDAAGLGVLKEAGGKFSFYNGGNRWTYGRYMKALVDRHDLVLRLTWHFNIVAGDPYYALDCREDDYCWFNTDANQQMVPSTHFLSQILPGLNDYRYLCTLQRLVKEKPNHAATPDARKLLDEMLTLEPGKDRGRSMADVGEFSGSTDADRKRVADVIVELMR